MNAFVRDACDFGDSVEGAADIAEKGLDTLSEHRKARRSGYAENELVFAGGR